MLGLRHSNWEEPTSIPLAIGSNLVPETVFVTVLHDEHAVVKQLSGVAEVAQADSAEL